MIIFKQLLFLLVIVTCLSAKALADSKCDGLYIYEYGLKTKKGLVFKDFTTIKNGHKQFAESQILDGENFHQHLTSLKKNELGDDFTIVLKAEKTYLGIDGSKPSSSTTVVKSNSPAISSMTNEQIARDYVVKSASPNTTLSESSIQVLTKMMLRNEKMMKDAKAFLSKSSKEAGTESSGDLRLANNGSLRYFWYQPNNASKPVPARVLDIHPIPREKGGYDFSILVESLGEESVYGYRANLVSEIAVNEFNTIRRDKTYSAESSEEQFYSELTVAEIETIKFAKSLNLKLYGYSDFRRSTEAWSPIISSISPLDTMNNISWLAMKAEFNNNWGSYEHLKLDTDSESVNFIDVFSRLSPNYVLENYPAIGFQYTWIIDERGLLKIIPKMREGNNLRSQILRAASGRKIFAGGDLTMNRDRSLNITYESNSYQAFDSAWGISNEAFQASGANLNRFVQFTFFNQAKARINQFKANESTTYTKVNFDDFNGHQRQQNYSYHSGDEYFSGFNQKQYAQASESSNLKWDIQKGEVPLSLSQWLEKTGQASSHISEMSWASYVFNVNVMNTKLRELKRTYKKLSLKFHPDKAEYDDAEELQKTLNTAYDILSVYIKGRR